MKTVKNEFGKDVLADESLLNAKDIIYKTLKKTKFSGVKDENFFSYLDDEDKNGNQVLTVQTLPFILFSPRTMITQKNISKNVLDS